MLENALPISISSLAACLKQNGFTAELFDTTFYKWGEKSDTEHRIEGLQIRPFEIKYKNGDVYEDLKQKIIDFQPNLIGFSVVEPTFSLGLKLLQYVEPTIKKNNIKVAFGGVHCILAPETFEKLGLVDFLCVSEGEVAFVELCKKIKKGEATRDVKGFWVREGDSWRKNERSSLVDLDMLPSLDFDVFESSYLHKYMMGKSYKTISIEITRGCPYRCSYCGDHALRELFKSHGNWFRQKSLEKIEREFDSYIKKYQPEFVYIISESFLAQHPERFKNYIAIYKKHPIPFWFNTRSENITEEKIKMLKEINCQRVSIGIESGNESYRMKRLKRLNTNAQILKAAQILRDYEISFSVNIIIGHPDETREMIFDGINLCREARADAVSVHIFNPYHGTEARNFCIERGYIKPDMIADDFFQDYCLKGNTLSHEEVMGLFRTIPLYVTLDQQYAKEIARAEKFDGKGNKKFDELKQFFYQIKGW
jgi:radical SAM superfamily enzyme YgiQ (UPF0313 family)